MIRNKESCSNTHTHAHTTSVQHDSHPLFSSKEFPLKALMSPFMQDVQIWKRNYNRKAWINTTAFAIHLFTMNVSWTQRGNKPTFLFSHSLLVFCFWADGSIWDYVRWYRTYHQNSVTKSLYALETEDEDEFSNYCLVLSYSIFLILRKLKG